MQFIKDNLFYSVLVAVVLVLGGALVALNLGAQAAADAKQAPIVEVSQTIGKLYSRPYVNTRVNSVRERQVHETERLLKRTIANAARWSRGDGRDPYRPMVLPKHDKESGRKIGTIPAFPIDKDLYKDYTLGYWATVHYRERMDGVFKPLHPASPPNGEEIQAELDRINSTLEEIARRKERDEELRKLEQEAQDKDADGGEGPDRKAPAPTPIAPPARGLGPVVGPDRGLPARGEMPVPTGRDGRPLRGPGTEGGPEDAEAEAVDWAEKARNNMRLFKAGLPIDPEGKDPQRKKQTPPEVSTYVDPGALDLVFPAARPDPSETDIWEAQLHLWIVEDLVEAIARVNTMALTRPKGLPVGNGAKKDALPRRRTVPNSAIKRLVSIRVPRGYVTGPPGAAAPGPRAVPRRPGPGPGPMAPMREPAPGGTSGLTGRKTCKQFEIKHYTVTVVMDVRYLPDLQRVLLTHNQHTILNVTMAAIDVSDTDQGDLYYYGIGAVMRVTIEGELLMISEWTRGSWVPDKNAWAKGAVPLMPVKVLREINDQDASALRPEDVTRMNSEK